MTKTLKLPISALILIVLYTVMLLAGFIAPYHADHEFRLHPYEDPSTIHFFENGSPSWPYVYATKVNVDENYSRNYEELTHLKYPLKFFIKGDSYKFLGFIPLDIHLFGIQGDIPLYILGSDQRGRDIFSRIVHGSLISLSIGLIGVFISMILGCLIGGISGYYGGKTDWILMRLSEMLMLFPGFYLLLTLRASFPPTLSSSQVYFLIIIILSVLSWAALARIIRGQVLSIRKRAFVLALKGFGFSDFYILTRHIIPQLKSYLIVTATLAIPGYILGESALSLIGLGIQEPQVSWGTMLAESMAIAHIQLHPWILIPGLFIIITVLSFNLLGDHLRDKLDVKLK